MSKIIPHLETGLDSSIETELEKLCPGYSSFRILRKSIDARKGKARFVYRLEVFFGGESPPSNKIEIEKINSQEKIPEVLIVGSGPAGLFAALRLTERGIGCRIFERGSKTTERMKAISQYWRYGNLNPDNNVCFGEGGAGLYSDGKLITRIKSEHIPYVLDRLVQFGAPEEIRYISNPHIGSDKIRKLIPPLRNYLLSQGCEFHFDTPITRLLFQNEQCIGIETKDGRQFHSNNIVLATGHSATEIYQDLHQAGVKISGKSFALGFRIEHPQEAINKIQFKSQADHPALGPATYRLAHHDQESESGVYSFCMCPGGYVISSSTDLDSVVSNGMSNFARNSPYANSAIVVSVDFEKNFGTDVFGGLDFIRTIEKKAFSKVAQAGGTKELPSQTVMNFLERKSSSKVLPNSSPSHAVGADLHDLLPSLFYERICESLQFFHERRMRGFISKEAQLFGVETRTSAPIRIDRDPESLESCSHSGLYPTGEGAGYAGGITSAAADGVRVAEAIVRKFV